MEQTQTLAEQLAPKLLAHGIKITLPADFDSDGIFLVFDSDNGVVTIMNPKYTTCKSNDQFDFGEYLKPIATQTMIDGLKEHDRKNVKLRDASQNYLNLRKSRF